MYVCFKGLRERSCIGRLWRGRKVSQKGNNYIVVIRNAITQRKHLAECAPRLIIRGRALLEWHTCNNVCTQGRAGYRVIRAAHCEMYATRLSCTIANAAQAAFTRTYLATVEKDDEWVGGYIWVRAREGQMTRSACFHDICHGRLLRRIFINKQPSLRAAANEPSAALAPVFVSPPESLFAPI